MKKAFTMIELVFVIMILGIISAIAVPKLAATREDAQVVKAAADISTIVKDIETYYAVNGELPATSDLAKITNVALEKSTKSYGYMVYKVGDYECLYFVTRINCKPWLDKDSTYVASYIYPSKDKNGLICEKALGRVKSLVGYAYWNTNYKEIVHILDSGIATVSKGVCKDLG